MTDLHKAIEIIQTLVKTYIAEAPGGEFVRALTPKKLPNHWTDALVFLENLKDSDILKESPSCGIKRVEKGWGYEDWICNSALYCGKLLHFERGKRCSYHYHVKKDETFYVQKGTLLVTYGDTDDLNESYSIILRPGDRFYVPPGLRHQMLAIEETDMFEFSTQHFDEDSIRVKKGD